MQENGGEDRSSGVQVREFSENCNVWSTPKPSRVSPLLVRRSLRDSLESVRSQTCLVFNGWGKPAELSTVEGD